MTSPLSQLNRFFELAIEKNLNGSAQLVYLHLFNQFNRAHWTETLYINDAELLKRINCHDSSGKPCSIDTIRRAKQVLKLKGFIDFKSGKGNQPTQYQLIDLTPADTPANTPARPLIVDSYVLNVLEDNKTNENASAHEKYEIDTILEFWEQSGGSKLNQLIVSKIAALLKVYSVTEIKAAIEKASTTSNSRYGFSYEYFSTKLKNNTPKKGVANGEYNYEKPSEPKKPDWYREP